MANSREAAIQRLLQHCCKPSAAEPSVIANVTLRDEVFKKKYGEDKAETVCVVSDVIEDREAPLDREELENALKSAKEELYTLSKRAGVDEKSVEQVLQHVSKAGENFGAVMMNMLDKGGDRDFDSLSAELESSTTEILAAFTLLIGEGVEGSDDSRQAAIYSLAADIIYEQAEQYILEDLTLSDTVVVEASEPSAVVKFRKRDTPVKRVDKPRSLASFQSFNVGAEKPTQPVPETKEQSLTPIGVAKIALQQHINLLSSEAAQKPDIKKAVDARRSELQSAQTFLDYFRDRVMRAVQDPETLTKIVTFVTAAVLQTAAAQFMWYQYGRRIKAGVKQLEQLLTSPELSKAEGISEDVVKSMQESNDPMHYFTQLSESESITAMEQQQLDAYKVSLHVATAYSKWWSELPVSEFEYEGWAASWAIVLSESVKLLQLGSSPSQQAVAAYAEAVQPHLPLSTLEGITENARQIAFTNMMTLPNALMRSMHYSDMLQELFRGGTPETEQQLTAPYAFELLKETTRKAAAEAQRQNLQKLTTQKEQLREIEEDVSNSVFMRHMSTHIGNPFVASLLKNMLGATFRAVSWELRQIFQLDGFTTWFAGMSAPLQLLADSTNFLFQLATLNHMNATLATAVGAFVGGTAADYYNDLLQRMDAAASNTAANMSSSGGSGWKLWARSMRFMGRLVQRGSNALALLNNRLVGWSTMWNGFMLATGVALLYHNGLVSGALALSVPIMSRSLTRVACMVAVESFAFVAVQKLVLWSRSINDVLPAAKRYALITPLTVAVGTTLSTVLLTLFRNVLLTSPGLFVEKNDVMLELLQSQSELDVNYDVWLQKQKIVDQLLSPTSTALVVAQSETWYTDMWDRLAVLLLPSE